ncbi:two component transcriptional regulator, LytTR family [Arachidicoccus rhizosphaerae]|uniref:Two component transcriptional regulator, LytTR family n=1 Tax=Arachidicoccus rhizosphaerae TaxID=551991 RepID=A0A1H3VRE4_9BACT|nr:LytTR family transcriptional regulator DNA-binding domain-containing protein [Arachidicoccus rhizosphaerae]SDZ76814.1 two component transcriptional regulator, LytTR family [Arachidicoccus rhizosphaerae]
MRTIIIDDEPLARSLLMEILEDHKDIEIIAECNDGYEGIKAIQELQPDLIFLDIQMPKITGFEMLELLDYTPKIIFTTAYDEYALKAFEVNALDYLLKPIHAERLASALSKVRSYGQGNNGISKDQIITQLPEQMQRIVVKVNGEVKILPIKDVYYLEAADDYVKVHSTDKYYLKHQTMSHFEKHLPEHQFIRIHRSYIVNIQHIHKVDLYEKDQYCVILRNDVRLQVSRTGYAKLKAELKF